MNRNVLSFEENIVLENNRVRLTPLSMDHLEFLLPIAEKHPKLLQFSPSEFGTQEMLEKYMETAIASRAQESRYPFAIFDKQEKIYAGSTSFGNISNRDLRLEIGWTWMGKEFQRTGLNRNCKYLMLRHAFQQWDFQRVEFKTDSRNLQSRVAIEKIGGKYEGEFRSHTLMPDGYRRHTVYYSILKDEWPLLVNTVFKEIEGK